MTLLERLAHDTAAIAHRAAAAILAVYESEFAVEHKDDRSPLTAADLAANRVIIEGLAALDPVLPVLSEESAAVGWEERARWTRYWLVDPLDGTREFVKRNGEFTVNIALIEGHAPVLGVIQAPVTGAIALAWRDGGAWRADRREGPLRRIATRARGTPLEVAGSRSHASGREGELLSRLGHHARHPLGSSLKFICIAAGEADIYLRLGPTSEWDTAAGQCILEQAGGAVLGFDARPLRYNTRDSLINPDFVAVGDARADWSALFAG